MKFLLTIYLCSFYNGVCLTPHTFYNEPHDDMYSCLLSGYEKSINKTKEIGRVEINKHGILGDVSFILQFCFMRIVLFWCQRKFPYPKHSF